MRSLHTYNLPSLRFALGFAFLAVFVLFEAARAHAATKPVSPWAYSAPVITSWRRPDYPTALAAKAREGKVTVRFVVDDLGSVVRARVLQSLDPVADQAALDDIRTWKFRPAQVADLSSYCCLDVDVLFRASAPTGALPTLPTPAEMPREVKAAFPEPIFTPDPVYPADLAASGEGGTVRVLLLVDNKGRVVGSQAFNSIPDSFQREAVAAAKLWTFKPAHQGDIDVPALYEADMIFNPHNG